ncbi:MAG: hypothetical protein IT555_05190 [Acetobacteraceae bacterium]|nr:hypothetical protein [Acetobacteraceae bacterium]
MKPYLPLALLLCTALPAVAQPPPSAGPVPKARLPAPPVADEAPPSAFVTAARSAIAAGRTGEAIEAIERAESRVLVRSVRPSRAEIPSEQAPVRLLTEARQALGQGDRATALAKLAEALANPTLDSPVE